MFPILFKLGPVTLHAYGFLVALGFLAAVVVARGQFNRQNLPETLLDQLILSLMLGGLIGARGFFFLFEDRSEFLEHPLQFFRVWEGGLVYYGGFVVCVGVLLFFSIRKKTPIIQMTDAFAAPLLIGQSIGRLGCFAAGCCYGKPTDSFLGVTFTSLRSLAPLGIAVHPTQLYSSFSLFLLFLGALWLSRRSPKSGALSAYYLIFYGVFRFLIEFLRDDFRGDVWGGLFPSQWIAAGSVFLGVGLGWYAWSKRRG